MKTYLSADVTFLSSLFAQHCGWAWGMVIGDPDKMPGNEDSQESLPSVALQNAMGPLPDTQPTQPCASQQSPPDNQKPLPQLQPQVQLLSRPREFLESDISKGFSWGQSVKITPGHFNRRLPSHPVNTAPQNGRDAVVVADKDWFADHQHATKSVALPIPQPRPMAPPRPKPQSAVPLPTATIQQNRQSPPQAYSRVTHLDYVSDQMPEALAPPKPPPFKDIQLSMPVPSAQKQACEPFVAPVPQPIQYRQENALLRSPENVGSMPEFHNSPSTWRPIPQDSARSARISLRNDVSVSSPHPPRKIPPALAPRPVLVNRPLRDVRQVSSRSSTPSTQAPSCPSTRSRSNVKKKRSANRRHDQDSSYHARASQRLETPCNHSRLVSSPQTELGVKFREKVQMSAANCAGVLNQNFMSLEAEVKKHINSIHSLEDQIQKQQDKLAHYEAETSTKANTIQELQQDRARLLQELEDSKTELNGRSSKLSKLEDKCRTYKEYLNEAVVEQQKLYKATRDKCDGAIRQMKAEEEKRDLLQRQEQEQAEAARVKLREVVKATVDDFSHKEHKFKITIDSLNEKIKERDAETSRERERVTTILQQNESIESLQKTVNDLGGQIGRVVEIVDGLTSQQNHRDDTLVEEVQNKLDQMTERLQALDAHVQSPAVIEEKLSGALEKSIAPILATLEPILGSQTETKDILQQFTIDLEGKLADLWGALNEREDLLEDLVNNKQEETAELALMLQYDVQEKERELLEQSQHLQEMEETLTKNQELINSLRLDIAEIDRAQAQDMQQSDRLKEIQAKHDKLQDEATAKAALVVELQTKLLESEAAMVSQAQEHHEKAQSFQQQMDDAMASAQRAQIQAVESVQRETLQKTNKIKEDFENRLNHALEQREMLRKELETAKARVLALQRDSKGHEERMALLEIELEKAKTQDAEMREEAERKDEAHRVSLEEESGRVQNLRKQLIVWEKKFESLLSNAQAYDKAAVVVLGHIKQWTQQNTTIRDLALEMAHDQSENPRQKIDKRFTPLIEIEIIQRAVMKYCQDQEKAVDVLTGFAKGRNGDAGSRMGATADLSLATSFAGSEHFPGGTAALAAALLDRARRVTLRSPAQTSPHPRPPSVNTEQERRRTANPPKSIMKAVSYDISNGILPSTAHEQSSQESEDMQQHINGARSFVSREMSSKESKINPGLVFRGGIVKGNTVLNYGPYNRPVAGSSSRPEFSVEKRGKESTPKPTSPLRDLRDEDEVRGQSVASRKRHENFEGQQSVSSKRPKQTVVTEVVMSTPRLSPPPGSVENAPTAPRKNHHQRNSDMQSKFSIHVSRFPQATQRNNVAGLQPSHKTSGGSLSRNDSQDPLSLFYQRRQPGHEDEDSQESVAFSQGACGDSLTCQPMVRRFSGMP